MVRRSQYRGSNLRTEVRFDDTTPQLPHTVDSSFHRRSPAPSPWPSSDGNRCTLGPYCEDDECDHTRPETQRPYFPSLATQACIRMPRQASWGQREAESKYRFPSSEALKQEGIPCASPACSAPGSAYTSPINSPISSPPDTPADTPPASKPTSLRTSKRRGGVFDDINIDTDSDGSIDSIDSLTTHVGGTRLRDLQNARSQPQLGSKMGVPFWRRKAA